MNARTLCKFPHGGKITQVLLATALLFWGDLAPPVHAQITQALNNASSTIAAEHGVGSGTLILKAGEGPRFGNPTSQRPIRVTVAKRLSLVNGQLVPGSTQTIYNVTGRTGDTLTGLTAVEGTSDQAFSRLDPVASLITAGTVNELSDVVSDIDVDLTEISESVDGKADADAVVLKEGGAQTVAAPLTLAATTTGKASGSSVVVSAAVSNVALTSNAATLTTSSAHGFKPADQVVVSGLATTDLKGTYIVVTTPTTTTFTYTLTHANIGSTADSGTAVVTRAASVHEFKTASGKDASRFDNSGALVFDRDLTSVPARWGDGASLSFRQSFNGVTGGHVAVGFYDKNFLFNETPTKTNLSLQSYFLDDGSYYSGRSLIISQDRNKVTGQIAEMGGQTMIGASTDINAPGMKVANQLNLSGEKYRYCYGAFDAADIDPNYPAGGVYSDRGFGKNTWLVGPRGETLWGNYLNPNGDNSDPELWRLAKLWLSTATNHMTVEGSGQNATTTYFDLYGPTGGNAVLQLGSRGTQNALWIGTSASTTGSANLNLGNQTIMRFYNNPIGVAGASVAIGTDDVGSVLTVDSAPSNIGTPVITARGKNGQLGDLIRTQDYQQNTTWRVNKNGFPIIKKTTAPPDADLGASEMSIWLDATPGATKLKIKAKDSGGTVRVGEIPLSWVDQSPALSLAA